MDKLKNNVKFGRVAIDLTEEQKYMISFASVNPKELYLLEAFPEVIMVEIAEKINNGKRPLLTVGGIDSNGNMFIFLGFLCTTSNPGCSDGFLVCFFLG